MVLQLLWTVVFCRVLEEQQQPQQNQDSESQDSPETKITHKQKGNSYATSLNNVVKEITPTMQ